MSGIGRADIAFWGGVLVGLVTLEVLGFFTVRERLILDNDFAFIWVGPAAVVRGGDPWDPATWHATTLRLGALGGRESVYDFPPWTALALLPIGFLPLVLASWIWSYAGLVAAAIAMFFLVRRELATVPAAGFLVGLMTVASQPAIVNFYDGEFSFVLIVAVVLVLLGMATRRQTLAGAGGLMLLLKPNLFLIAFPALLRAGVARGWRRFVAIAVGGTALAVVMSFLTYPGWLGGYLALVQGKRLENPKTTVLPYALREVFGDVGVVVGVVALLVLVALALRFDPRSDAYAPAWLAVALVVTPYLHSYDQLVILGPTTVAIGALARRGRRRAMALAAFAFVDLVIVAALLHDKPALAIGRETQNGLVPAMLVALIIAALWRDRRAPERLRV